MCVLRHFRYHRAAVLGRKFSASVADESFDHGLHGYHGSEGTFSNGIRATRAIRGQKILDSGRSRTSCPAVWFDSHFFAPDDELRDLIIRIPAQRIGQRHVAHRLVVPGVAAADERPRRVRQASAVGAELIAGVEMRRLGQPADVERIALAWLRRASADASARPRRCDPTESPARWSAPPSPAPRPATAPASMTRQQAPHWLQRFIARCVTASERDRCCAARGRG